MIKTYTTQSSARRALSKIGTNALQAAKDLIYVNDDDLFAFDTEAAERVENDHAEVDEIHAEQCKSSPVVAPVAAPVVDETDAECLKRYGLVNCPHCGIHLCNGVGSHLQEVNGKLIKHSKFEYACLACNGEFGPSIKGGASSEHSRKPSATQSETMKTTMKLNREIMATQGKKVLGTWPNACRMWKAHQDWMTSSQQDALTAKLYTAAKKGERVVVEINGRSFQLVNVG